jgi:YVTN family beta-propeller protein
MVVNSGSNSVSIIDIPSASVQATISVGSRPVAAAVSPDASTAYVLNYNDATVSKINLSSYSLVQTQSVGAHPSSIDVDPSGRVWVGGDNYVKVLDGNSLGTISSSNVSGAVTSLRYSNALGAAVASLVANASGSAPSNSDELSSGSSSLIKLIAGASPSLTVALASPAAYATSSQAGQLSPASELGPATVVSESVNGGIAVTATSLGFAAINMDSGQVFFSGATPAPARSIAFSESGQEVYLAVPDSDLIMIVPIPSVPL